MKRTIPLAFLTIAAFGMGAALRAAPPVDTSAVPKAAEAAKDQTQQATSDAQKAVDARKDGPSSQSAPANAANQANQAAERAQSSANQAAERAQSSANQAADRAQSSANQAVGGAAQGVNNAANRAQQTVERATQQTQGAANRAADQTNRAAGQAADQANQATQRATDQANQATQRATDRAGQAANQAIDQTQRTGERTADQLNRATNQAGEAVNRASDRANQAVDRATDRANQAVDRAADQVDRATDGRQVERRDGNVNADARVNIDAARVNTALGIGWADFNDRLVIDNVAPNGIWANLGLQAQDQIVTIGGRRFTTPNSFYQYAATLPVGQRVPIVVMRDGVQQTLYWTPNDQFAQLFHTGFAPGQAQQQFLPGGPQHFLGLTLDERINDAAVVASVAPNSPAARAQIRAGDAIVSVNGQSVRSPNEFMDAVSAIPANTAISLAVSRMHEVQLHADATGRQPSTAARPVVPNEPQMYRAPVRRFFRRF